MDFPQGFYQMMSLIAERLPHLRPAQQRGLTVWVWGTILAHRACQTAVMSALLSYHCKQETIRSYLREWLADGEHKAAPCSTQVDVQVCFPDLLRWLLSLWTNKDIAIAVDACALHDRVTALVVSVLYQGCAIPVAWKILPGNTKGEWMAPFVKMLELLGPVVPESMNVLVMADRGLWSPSLWRAIRKLHWHPVLRISNQSYFRPMGGSFQQAIRLAPRPGTAWVGEGEAFSSSHKTIRATLMVYWGEGHEEPWLVLSDLPVHKAGVCWYGLRMWIELGFRALKGLGWDWEKTRRSDPERVARHFLVMAVATLWVMACGTRVEEAVRIKKPAHQLRAPIKAPIKVIAATKRKLSLFSLGVQALIKQMIGGQLWKSLWLNPDPLPEPPSGVKITYHVACHAPP